MKAANDKITGFDIKTCPFCGSAAELHRLGNEDSTHGWVECAYCHASLRFCATFEAAVNAWNKRAGDAGRGNGKD